MCVDSVSLSLFLSVSVSEHQQTNEQKLTKIEQNFPNCWRRQSFWESYSKGANDAAQSLAVRRNKEAAVRDLFRKAVARLIPLQVNPHPTPPALLHSFNLSFFVQEGCRLPHPPSGHPPNPPPPLLFLIHSFTLSLFVQQGCCPPHPPSGHHLLMPAELKHML